ncbi:MAG: large conductance mechanosensitive channel protein MscL, partial [Clostridia bacterium]|nr:large conductance mechanosensitive channel protein MscL [Clostridia bacterium]
MGQADKEALDGKIAAGQETEKKKKRRERRERFKKEKTSFFTDFKKFITRGNVLDMAVAVIIGAAFNPIVTSLVNNIIMPAIGYLIGDMDFTELKTVLVPEVLDEAGNVVTAEVAIGWGVFIGAVINFL